MKLSKKARNILIVTASAGVCFLVGGGAHLLANPGELASYFYRSESVHEKIGAYTFAFLFGGFGAALGGALAAAVILGVIERRRKT